MCENMNVHMRRRNLRQNHALPPQMQKNHALPPGIEPGSQPFCLLCALTGLYTNRYTTRDRQLAFT